MAPAPGGPVPTRISAVPPLLAAQVTQVRAGALEDQAVPRDATVSPPVGMAVQEQEVLEQATLGPLVAAGAVVTTGAAVAKDPWAVLVAAAAARASALLALAIQRQPPARRRR